MQTILLVEDDTVMIDVISAILRTTPARLIIAQDGQQAIEQVERHHPSLIVLDLRLPSHKLQGWDVIQSIRSNPRFWQIPIIAMSAGGNEALHRALQAGANEAIEKPFKMHRIRALVEHYLQQVQR